MLNEIHPKVLFIEDNGKIRHFVKTMLMNDSYHLLEAANASDGLEIIKEDKPDIILLDLGLPDQDGLSVIKHLREWTAVPVIVLSARDQETDKIVALDCGADDYITKPFSIEELKARMRVALRHARFIFENETPLFETGDLKVDLINRKVWRKEEEVNLTPIQYQIVALLVKKVNKVVAYQEILNEIWGKNHLNDIEYLRIYMFQIRNKLEDIPSKPKYFMTEPGVGYRLLQNLA